MATQRLSIITLLSGSLLLTACGTPQAPVVIHSRPVKSIVIGSETGSDTRTFPAIVDAIQKADISFRVGGKIQRVLVKEGDEVKKGQLLAELDPTDFKIRMRDQTARFNTDKANYDRAEILVKKGAISKVDRDNLRARFFTAKANLEKAQQDLAYTKLTASFNGLIARRYVENFEQILASQTIFALEDISALKLKINIPENLVIAISRNHKEKRKLFARFNSIKDHSFPLSFVEAATKANPTTRTFTVTLKMDNPEHYNILPGMTAMVYAQIHTDEIKSARTVALPLSAVVANSKKQAVVWVVDKKTMTVHPEKVTTDFFAGNKIRVSGLKPGERIVTAGAAFLRDGMKVTLLKTGEQPK